MNLNLLYLISYTIPILIRNSNNVNPSFQDEDVLELDNLKVPHYSSNNYQHGEVLPVIQKQMTSVADADATNIGQREDERQQPQTERHAHDSEQNALHETGHDNYGTRESSDGSNTPLFKVKYILL